MLQEISFETTRCISLEIEVDLLFAFDGHVCQHLRVKPLHGGDQQFTYMVRPEVVLFDAAKHASDGDAL